MVLMVSFLMLLNTSLLINSLVLSLFSYSLFPLSPFLFPLSTPILILYAFFRFPLLFFSLLRFAPFLYFPYHIANYLPPPLSFYFLLPPSSLLLPLSLLYSSRLSFPH